MVVLDEAKQKFILEVILDEAEHKMRDEERKKTGRYLAVSVVLFIVALGLYHAISAKSTKISALLGAAMIMFLYLLWLIYASQRRKQAVKKSEENIERQVSDVLENLNNMKTVQGISGPHENQVYASSEDELERPRPKKEKKTINEEIEKENRVENNNIETKHQQVLPCQDMEIIPSGKNIFIRTYSIG
ncbi:hypothetical protein GWI33_020689 [Rhynchophorus ferrugineus]|uniref:Uncharacterized protein n=1 Tax=Rhynchophorus ferrugineus TaxID=354439 RepID=A0A834M5L5_RHYFE|nr:hypothetical protein GWI33_020689 [Rhynchophorus ferrugineus]